MAGVSSVFRVSLALGLSLAGLAHGRTITQKTARKLVEEAVVAMGEDARSVDIGPWAFYWAPEFYTFQAWRHNLREGLLVTYYFAVNPWTGDVWDAMGCKRITSKAIEREQKSIWIRSRLPDEARDALHDKSPACCAAIEGSIRLGNK